MFIEIAKDKLVIEATKEEWLQLRNRSNTSLADNRCAREFDFAIHTILQQED